MNQGNMPLSRLEPADVAAAARLSAVVGWNQNEADWERLVTLHPEGAFAVRDEDGLVGTATLVRYGDRLAWLGMVIVAPERRGEGLGAALIDRALAAAVPGSTVGLDATDLGAPLYLRRGFVSVGSVQRWAGVLVPVAADVGSDGVARQAEPADLDSLATFDIAACGVDRRPLLARLLAEPATSVWVVQRGGAPVAYAALRSGRERLHVGPVVSADTAALTAVMNGVASAAGSSGVFVDVLVGRPAAPARGQAARARGQAAPAGAAREWPAGFGLHPVRTLSRMAWPAPGVQGAQPDWRAGVLMGPSLAAATGLEWG